MATPGENALSLAAYLQPSVPTTFLGTAQASPAAHFTGTGPGELLSHFLSLSPSNFLCFHLIEQQIAEYDLAESVKDSRSLSIAFAKRIFQSALPRSMTRVRCGEARSERLLVADSEQKLLLFDAQLSCWQRSWHQSTSQASSSS